MMERIMIAKTETTMLFVAQTLAFSLNTWTDAAGLSTAMLEEGGGRRTSSRR